MLVTGLVLATGGGAFLAPLLASGCLFGSKNKAVKYAEEAPSRSAEQPSRAPEKCVSAAAPCDVVPVHACSLTFCSMPLPTRLAHVFVGWTQGIKDQQQPSQTSANDKPSTGDGSQSARPASGGANNDWNPVKEIEDIANALSGEANALTLLEPIGQGGFGTGVMACMIGALPTDLISCIVARVYADDSALLADSPGDLVVLLGMVDAVASKYGLFITGGGATFGH
eukprot:360194-Chlamydomonas_euryale.AAC.3